MVNMIGFHVKEITIGLGNALTIPIPPSPHPPMENPLNFNEGQDLKCNTLHAVEKRICHSLEVREFERVW